MKLKRYNTNDITFEELFNSAQYFQKSKGSDDSTCLIYYGGKSRDAGWILNHFPPHRLFVDVFGGGGAVTFAYSGRGSIIYNDIGNVSNFFKVLRDSPDELYRKLYFTPFSRQEFYFCRDNWYKEMEAGNLVEWARQWFVVINQGYTHEEHGESWHVTKSVSAARSFSNHVDDLPRIVRKIRSQIHVEQMDFAKLIPMYDVVSDDFNRGDTLFYCDPPYIVDTRVSHENYTNEMGIERHEELLNILNNIRGQAVVSGYDHPLYNEMLAGWRRDEITHKSSIQNSSSIDNRGDRTEVVWIKEHYHGLWNQEEAPSNVSRVSLGRSNGEKLIFDGRRKTL